ncbi:MAG: High-affinity branched-chain amino acid transport ATP-binding protein LivF [Firmicutes bacterium ADurb.Bin356]|nr:MAG: High-affinity branched-chain amino acid transport ATP-binding protein LivF [Firmicutes bacterium ADurb.Bin356]
MMLEVKDLHVTYGAIRAVKGIDFYVNEGEIVTLIGSNGAGKTTTLRTISGLEKAVSGNIIFKGIDITNKPPHQIVGMGITHVPEGRRIFTNLTVMDNLKMGANLRKDAAGIKKDMDEVFDRFPRLKERSGQSALTLSGGEQQMLAVGRAMMSRGELVVLDEPSMGLAPMIVDEIFRVIQKLNEGGATILLVEQNAYMALNLACRAYVLETGNITIHGAAKDLLRDPRVKQAYLGS